MAARRRRTSGAVPRECSGSAYSFPHRGLTMRGGLLQAEEPGRILLGHQVDLRLSEARVGEDPYREAEGFRRARVHCGAMRRLLIVHGPNLNLLGTREPAIYGSTTLADIDRTVADAGRHRSVEVRSVQSNSEGTITD